MLRKFRIVLAGNALLLSPWNKADSLCREIAEELTCERSQRNPSSRNGGTTVTVHKLYSVGEQDTCLTYSGFYHRLRRFLEKRNCQVEVDDRQPALPEPRWACLDSLPPLRSGQPEAIAAVIAATRGMVVCPTAFGKSFVIRVLCLLYPQLNILVVTKMGRVTQSLYDRITEVVDRPVAKLFGSKACWPEDAKIIVTTTKSLYKVRPDWADLLLFDEAHNAAAPDVSGVLSTFARTRLIGFTATPEGRGDGTDLLTEAFFGQRICSIDYQDAVGAGTVAQIKVLLAEIKGAPIRTDDMTTLMMNKRGYWWNELRNRRLLQAAAEYFRADDSVLYYVETVEHALYLRKLLPGVPIAHSGIARERWDKFLKRRLVTPEDVCIRSPDLDQLEADFREGRIRRVVCTGIWKEGVDFPDLAGLVRFDGGRGSIISAQIVGRLSRIGADGSKAEGLVIDALDNFGPRYYGRSTARIRTYKENGWNIVKI